MWAVEGINYVHTWMGVVRVVARVSRRCGVLCHHPQQMTALVHDKETNTVRTIPCTGVRVTDNHVLLRFIERIDEHSVKGWVEPLPASQYRLMGTTY